MNIELGVFLLAVVLLALDLWTAPRHGESPPAKLKPSRKPA